MRSAMITRVASIVATTCAGYVGSGLMRECVYNMTCVSSAQCSALECGMWYLLAHGFDVCATPAVPLVMAFNSSKSRNGSTP